MPGIGIRDRTFSVRNRRLRRKNAHLIPDPTPNSVRLVPMSFYFRKSVGTGPFRVNLSGGGVGYSVGAKGFRIWRSATGRIYTTFGVPGTGLRLSHSTGRRGCAGAFLLAASVAIGVGAIAAGVAMTAHA